MFTIKFNNREYRFQTNILQQYSETINDFIASSNIIADSFNLDIVNFKSEKYIVGIVLDKLSYIISVNENNILDYFSPSEFEAWYEVTDYLGINNSINYLKLDRVFTYLYINEKYYLLEQIYTKCDETELFSLFHKCSKNIIDKNKFYTYCINKLCKNYIVFKWEQMYNERMTTTCYLLTSDDNNNMVSTKVNYENQKIYIDKSNWYHKENGHHIHHMLIDFNKSLLNKEYKKDERFDMNYFFNGWK